MRGVSGETPRWRGRCSDSGRTKRLGVAHCTVPKSAHRRWETEPPRGWYTPGMESDGQAKETDSLPV
jgi:hypothetical protein